MTLILGIVLISYTLIAFEAIVPGGLLGILGFLGLIVAAYYSFLEFGGWFAPSLTFLLSGLGGLALVFAEFKWLSKSPLGQNLFLGKIVDGTSNSLIRAEDLLGFSGLTLTDLHPEGFVKVNDKDYDAYSESGFLPKGTEVKVIGLDAFRIRVEKKGVEKS
ncbi:MAG: NfeD family protein [Opitutales bacterium]|nr:NfeD family protein [Opitutales bacterium]